MTKVRSRIEMLKVVLLIVVAVSPASSQKKLTPDADRSTDAVSAYQWLPRPFFYVGPSMVGNGYQAVAESMGAGFLLNSRKLIGDFEASYMNARKVDDNTVNNQKGHERFLQGRAFYHWHARYFGGGAQWSETSTTNYTKNGWRPTFGGGTDHFSPDISYRLQALYVMPGTDKSNGLQGMEVQFWMPSPSAHGHFFYRQTLGVYLFHTTITDPTDRHLTAMQTGQRHTAAFLDFNFGWRF